MADFPFSPDTASLSTTGAGPYDYVTDNSNNGYGSFSLDVILLGATNQYSPDGSTSTSTSNGGTLEMLTVQVMGGNSTNLTLAALEVTAEGSEPAATLELLEIVAEGTGGTVTNVWQLPLEILLPEVDGSGLAGTVATADFELPDIEVEALQISGDANVELPMLETEGVAWVEQLGTASLTLPALDVDVADLPHGYGVFDIPLLTAQGTSVAENFGAVSTELRLLALAADGLTGKLGTATVEIPIFTAVGSGYGEYIGTLDVDLPMLVLEATGLDIPAAIDYTGWVLNTGNAALTKYTAYPFNSFAKFNNVYLAASDDGIYLLTGSTDNGADIAAHVLTGKTDFDTGMLKRVKAAYVRQKTDGHMSLRVITEENAGTDYQVIYNGATGTAETRVKTAEGIDAMYWQLRYANVAGSNFEVDALELLPVVLSSRTR